jgi:hypothetical protein
LFFERFVGILLFVWVGCTASAAGELHPGLGEFGTWKWVFRFCLFLVLNVCGISTDAGSSRQAGSIIPVGYTHLFFAIVSDVLIFSSSNRVRKLTRKYRFWWKKQRGWKIKI